MSDPVHRLFSAVRRLVKAVCPSFVKKVRTWRDHRNERSHWDARIADVLACPDNAHLRRVENAGEIRNGYQVMHNGLQVVVNGYYGDGLTRMLSANLGCHEPQEEVVFDAIVQTLPNGAVMVEAGAYWGFYSMWFCQVIRGAKVYLIEPAAENLAIGQRNFQENGCHGDFTHAYIGAQAGRHAEGPRIVSVESFLTEKGLVHLHVLHADVQGFEMEMLHGSRSLFEGRAIDYLFLSTHTMELHAQCIEFLRGRGYCVLVSVDLEETHSVDPGGVQSSSDAA